MTNLKQTLSGAACSLALAALCLALTVTPAFALTWTPQTSGTTEYLLGVGYGGGQFVAVGSSGTILTSPDGVTWTERTSGTTEHLWRVTHDGSQFVVVGNGGTILTSPNGVTWTSRTSGTSQTLQGVAYSGSQFVAVGANGTIRTSPNGVTWTSRTSGTLSNLFGVVYGGSQFVVTGLSGLILTSPDGVTWTSQTVGTTNTLYGGAYDGSQFVVTGTGGVIFTSPDGVTWTSRTSGTGQSLPGIAYDGSRFVAVGSSGTILTSPDGVTWTADTSGTTNDLRRITYGGSQFVVVGNSGTILTSSGGLPTLALTKSVSPSSAKPGEAITYTIAFSNTETIAATNVVITDTVPVSVSVTSVISSGVVITDTGATPPYVWNVADLAGGQSGVITITGVLAKPLAAQVFSNTVTMAVSGTTKVVTTPLTVENVAPVANAGPDQSENVNQIVTLDGSGSSDDNGDSLTYSWTQSGGTPTVTLSDSTAQQPTFTAPGAPTVLTFTLTVTDTGALTGTDEVVVTVEENLPKPALVKTVSPTSAKPGQAITYTIAFSNTGAITATNVVITDTIPVSVTNTSVISSGVAITQVGGTRYVWQVQDLLQNDGGVITITGVLDKPLAAQVFSNTVTMAVSGTTKVVTTPLTVQNVAPVADAGPDQSAGVGDTVTLDGSGSSDDNGDALTYGWTQTGGTPTVTLSDSTAQQPTFTAPGAPTVLTFTLTVTDTGALTGTDEVVVTVEKGKADLAISKSLDRALGTITYTIVARNLGPDVADGAIVSDTIPANITGVSWTCVASGGATCTGGTGNNVSDTLTSFPVGGVVTYTVKGNLALLDSAVNTATVTPPAGVVDPDNANNSATVSTYRILLMPIFKNYRP